jgi:hypothetical protein
MGATAINGNLARNSGKQAFRLPAIQKSFLENGVGNTPGG